jgi:hypothetical protein
MIRRSAIAGVLAFAALGAGGCADFMQRSSTAPDWFNAKAKEFQGQGYPELSKIPEKRGSMADQAAWDAAAAALKSKAGEIQAATANAEANPTPEDDRATAAQLRARVEEAAAEADKRTAQDPS